MAVLDPMRSLRMQRQDDYFDDFSTPVIRALRQKKIRLRDLRPRIRAAASSGAWCQPFQATDTEEQRCRKVLVCRGVNPLSVKQHAGVVPERRTAENVVVEGRWLGPRSGTNSWRQRRTVLDNACCSSGKSRAGPRKLGRVGSRLVHESHAPRCYREHSSVARLRWRQ